MMSLEELRRVLGRFAHPFHGPVALGVLASARETGLLGFLHPRMKI